MSTMQVQVERSVIEPLRPFFPGISTAKGLIHAVATDYPRLRAREDSAAKERLQQNPRMRREGK